MTLMGLLVFTGIGSVLIDSYRGRAESALKILLPTLTGLSLFYLAGLGPLIDVMFALPLVVRVVVALLTIAPLGLCLGAFMPLGLAQVSSLTEHDDMYVAWAWAVNGFFSVIGSVSTTILSMAFGFRVVICLGLIVYFVAALTLRRLPQPAPANR